MLLEVRRILRIAESDWKSSDCHELLRWKLKKGCSICKTLPQRRDKWNELVNSMTEEGNQSIEGFKGSALVATAADESQTLSRGLDIGRVDENEHVDDAVKSWSKQKEILKSSSTSFQQTPRMSQCWRVGTMSRKKKRQRKSSG